MYFENFPQILYDYKINGVVDYRVVTDITRNVRFRKQILENVTLYDEYDIVEGETPEIISEKVYGTPYYHWVIMLVNQRYDYVNDFPLTTRELEEFIDTTYGDEKNMTHHYMFNDPLTSKSYQKDGINIIKLKESDTVGESIGSISVGDIVTSTDFGYTARVDQILEPSDGTYAKIQVSMRKGNFIPGSGKLTMDSGSIADVVSVTVPQLYSQVTNWQHEHNVNESKRRIKIVSPVYIDQILREFEAVI